MRLRTHAGQLEAMLNGEGEIRQAAGFPATGDESGVEYGTVKDWGLGGFRFDDHGSGTEREERDR
jgi:hypothetical protein